MRQYSPFFQTLHDEERPVGHLGRGTHYSVLRCITWHSQSLVPLNKAAFHDFAIIWDEDHDERIISVIESLYFQGLLAPALFVGEKKGSFTLLTEDSFAQKLGQGSFEAYVASVGETAQPSDEDCWPTHIHSFTQPEGYIINDSKERVALYLNNLRQLWLLGINPMSSRRVQ